MLSIVMITMLMILANLDYIMMMIKHMKIII